MRNPYLVGLTTDGLNPDGTSMFGELDPVRLHSAGVTTRFVTIPHAPVSGDGLDDVDAIISFGHAAFTSETARRLPRLKHVARFGAGYDGIDPVGLAREGVVTTTTPEAIRVPLAQAGLTLLLACAHRLIENHRCVVAGSWVDRRGQYRGIGLAGRTVGIVGLGRVGTLLAQYVQCLGATVVVTGRDESRRRAAEIGVRFLDLASLAVESDFMVVCTSLTPETRGLIGAELLARMPSHAYLVNIARGGVVDQTALVHALRSRPLAGCALDVLEDEPPSPDDPLLHLDNVILSPHALCWTEPFTRDVWSSVIDSMLAVAAGEIPPAALVRERLSASRWRGAL